MWSGRRKGKGKDPSALGGWNWKHYSQFKHMCVSLCDRALERESNGLCVCVRACVRLCACVCVYISVCMCRGKGREASGEKGEMKRMSVPLRKCHTGKICRF